MVRLPEEVTFSLEEEQALLADCLSSDRRIMLAAFAGDCIVGNVAIAPGRRTIQGTAQGKSWDCDRARVLQLRTWDHPDAGRNRICQGSWL